MTWRNFEHPPPVVTKSSTPSPKGRDVANGRWYFLLYLVTEDVKLEEIGPFVWVVFLFQLTKKKKDLLIEKSAEIQHKFIQNLSKSSKEI